MRVARRFPLDGQPFSAAGSYLSFNYLANVRDRSATVSLRSVHGGIPAPGIFDLLPSAPSATAYDATFEPDGALCIPTATPSDPARAEFASATVVRIHAPQTSGLALAAANLDFYDTLTPLGPTRWSFIKRSSGITLGIEASGAVRAETTWHGDRSDPVVFHLAPGATVFITERVDDAVAAASATPLPSYAEWLASAPPAPAEYADSRALAAYITWHALVAPSGALPRPAMYMSKNWMASVWSWDHCFNAMALGGFPALCWAQIATMLEHQSARGNLPDSINDREVAYAFTKPPVHGWTVDRMHAAGVLADEDVRGALDSLDRWTDFWLTERVGDGRALPAYYHGNDSGWDNATVFDGGVPVESPDLAAHLVLQLDSLARVAARLGLDDRAAGYRARADGLFATLVEKMWAGDRFTARHVPTDGVIDCASLLLLQPLMLGDRLPKEMLAALVARLESGGFVTDYGLATESTTSEKYTSDGYWRGPVWAPSTLLIVDGLKRAGEVQLARKIARAFCNAFRVGGSAENFDALTGKANRDTAYSWTASVFLVLASEYL
ncbi:hypothetical protein Q8F55_008345 [Vanrija albida]|uniref:Mannosylglycerate hydrolase MGH1-like glycoside hydrolase domain-containing protein n=1 Tax=Vanrija albida TaxID=181172 RepID=A0ABR3PW46_9TREE